MAAAGLQSISTSSSQSINPEYELVNMVDPDDEIQIIVEEPAENDKLVGGARSYVNIRGDGFCGYRAIAYLLDGDQDKYKKYVDALLEPKTVEGKKALADMVARNTCDDQPYDIKTAYAADVQMDAERLVVIAAEFGLTITIYIVREDHSESEQVLGSGRRKIALRYSGDGYNGHYDAVMGNGENDLGHQGRVMLYEWVKETRGGTKDSPPSTKTKFLSYVDAPVTVLMEASGHVEVTKQSDQVAPATHTPDLIAQVRYAKMEQCVWGVNFSTPGVNDFDMTLGVLMNALYGTETTDRDWAWGDVRMTPDTILLYDVLDRYGYDFARKIYYAIKMNAASKGNQIEVYFLEWAKPHISGITAGLCGYKHYMLEGELRLEAAPPGRAPYSGLYSWSWMGGVIKMWDVAGLHCLDLTHVEVDKRLLHLSLHNTPTDTHNVSGDIIKPTDPSYVKGVSTAMVRQSLSGFFFGLGVFGESFADQIVSRTVIEDVASKYEARKITPEALSNAARDVRNHLARIEGMDKSNRTYLTHVQLTYGEMVYGSTIVGDTISNIKYDLIDNNKKFDLMDDRLSFMYNLAVAGTASLITALLLHYHGSIVVFGLQNFGLGLAAALLLWAAYWRSWRPSATLCFVLPVLIVAVMISGAQAAPVLTLSGTVASNQWVQQWLSYAGFTVGLSTPAVCLFGRKRKYTEASTTKIRLPEEASVPCETKRATVCFRGVQGIRTYQFQSRCPHNDAVAILERHGIVEEPGLDQAKKWWGVHRYTTQNWQRYFPRFHTVTAMDRNEWVDRFETPRAQAIDRAKWDKIGPYTADHREKKQATIKAFTKAETAALPEEQVCDERLEANREDPDVFPAPRLIQGMELSYQRAMGPWIYSWTKTLGKIWDGKHSPIFLTSGRTPEEVGAWLSDCLQQKRPLGFVMGDFKWYDSTQTACALGFQGSVMRRFGMNSRLYYKWTRLLETRGRTGSGVLYKMGAQRHSGKNDTTGGNSLNNAIPVAVSIDKIIDRHVRHPLTRPEFEIAAPGEDYVDYLQVLHEHNSGIVTWRQCVLGDDNLWIVPRVYRAFIRDWEESIRELGYYPKMAYSEDLAKVEFCSGLFYHDGDTYCLGPKPGRILVRSGSYDTAKQLPVGAWMKALSKGLVVGCSGVPIVSAWAKSLFELTKDEMDVRFQREYSSNLRTISHEDDDRNIDFLARRYDLDPGDIVDLHNWCGRLGRSGVLYGDVVKRIVTVDYPKAYAL